LLRTDLTNGELEELADLINIRCGMASRLRKPSRLDAVRVLELLGARVDFEYLVPPGETFGKTVFLNEKMVVMVVDMETGRPKLEERLFSDGTVVLECYEYESRSRGLRRHLNFTAAHEAFHYVYHRDNYIALNNMPQAERHSVEKILERQADYGAGALLMPKQAITKLANRYLEKDSQGAVKCSEANLRAVRKIAGRFNVNPKAVAMRLYQLGISQEFLHVDKPLPAKTITWTYK